MKILLLGQTGFLGGELGKALENRGLDYFAPGRKTLDVTTSQLEDLCDELAPTVIINAVAYTNVDGAETESVNAHLLNAELPARLARISKKINARLIHFSTDYIFDGEKKDGYTEEDKPSPLSVYGESKYRGEKLVQEFSENFLIVRTSFPFGDNPKCFLQRVIKLAREKDVIQMVDGLVSSPTNFVEFAERVAAMLEGNYSTGVYHLTNFEACSRYEFTKETLRILGIKTKLERLELAENVTGALRPKFSVLLNTKLPQMTHWAESLEKYLLKKLI